MASKQASTTEDYDSPAARVARLQDQFARWFQVNGPAERVVRELRDECGMEERAAEELVCEGLSEVIENGWRSYVL